MGVVRHIIWCVVERVRGLLESLRVIFSDSEGEVDDMDASVRIRIGISRSIDKAYTESVLFCAVAVLRIAYKSEYISAVDSCAVLQTGDIVIERSSVNSACGNVAEELIAIKAVLFMTIR